ncbi:hypothetical protein VPH35_069706 [Triticum aestivum]
MQLGLANSMAKAPSPSTGRWWSTKRRILAALALIVFIAGIASVVSFVLRPGNIRFSITHASNATIKANSGLVQSVELNLTLVANNTSPRAGVDYLSSIVLLQYTSPSPDSSNLSIQAGFSELWSSQPPLSTTTMEVSALMSIDDWTTSFPNPATSGRRSIDGTASAPTLIRVLVVTGVRFKVGWVYTWPYSIRVLCEPVDYFFSFNGSLATTTINCWDA